MKMECIPPAGGGLSLLDKTPILSAPTGIHQSTTVINITGAGLLNGVWSNAGTTGNTVAVQIDGGSIYTMTHDNNTTTPVVMVPFKQSLKITASSVTGLRVSYSLA